VQVQVPSQLVMQQNKGPNILKRMTISHNTIGTIRTVPMNVGNGIQRVMIAVSILGHKHVYLLEYFYSVYFERWNGKLLKSF